jgi:hypothetical protein
MKIPEFKRSGNGIIAEFCGISTGFPNQGLWVDLDSRSKPRIGLRARHLLAVQQSKQESAVISDDAAIDPDGCRVLGRQKAG